MNTVVDVDRANIGMRGVRLVGIGARFVLLALLRFYKVGISPLLGSRCRYYPSCSDYAKDAIQYHGAARGTYLAFRRVCRCHPFSAGGVDPVPLASGRRGCRDADADAGIVLSRTDDAGDRSTDK